MAPAEARLAQEPRDEGDQDAVLAAGEVPLEDSPDREFVKVTRHDQFLLREAPARKSYWPNTDTVHMGVSAHVVPRVNAPVTPFTRSWLTVKVKASIGVTLTPTSLTSSA
jgi:hypothetical protein